MSDTEIMELVEEAKKPGKFSIIAALKDRAYPVTDINIYLNEQTAYDASQAKYRLTTIDVKDSQYAEAEKELDALVEKMSKEKYVFTISGISEGKREKIHKETIKKYPVEYTETKNPLTAEVKKEEVVSEDRNNLFTTMLWAEHIIKIVSPDGDVQDGLAVSEAIQMREALPIAAGGAINQAIEKIRNATAVFMYTVDEDFLAKS